MSEIEKLAREVRQLMLSDYTQVEAIRSVESVKLDEWKKEKVRRFMRELSKQMIENNEKYR